MEVLARETQDQPILLALRGDLVISELEPVQARLLEVMAVHAEITIDLSEVLSCDTAGLQVLCAAARQSEAEGHVLRLAAPSAAVEDALQMLNLRSQLPFLSGDAP